MDLSECLKFDPERASAQIIDFIRDQVRRFNKPGVLIGLSGGLDSSTVAYLCKNALGNDRVLGLILPERDTNPRSTEDAEKLARELGIPYKKFDITPMLHEMGAYDIFPDKEELSRSSVERTMEQLKRMTGRKPLFIEGFSSIYRPEAGTASGETAIPKSYINAIHAFATAKTRARMMVLFFHATLADYLVVGTTDRSEWEIGFYDKYGDAPSDISILKHLYKTQIWELAKHIGVPQYILEKPSSGDLLGQGLPNEAAIGMSYGLLDRILCGISKGYSSMDIAGACGVGEDTVNAVKRSMEIAKLRESMPFSL